MNTTIHQLQSTLEAARGDLKRLSITGTGQARKALLGRVLEKERELASLQGRPYAIPLNFPITWDPIAPAPHVLQNERHAFLIIRSAEGEEAREEEVGNGRLALVVLHGCLITRFGSPNDSAAHGHPLKGNGMESDAAQEVINSEWIAELKRIDKVHLMSHEAAWAQRRHYVFWFHDSMFECIAEGYTVEMPDGDLPGLLLQAGARLLEE